MKLADRINPPGLRDYLTQKCSKNQEINAKKLCDICHLNNFQGTSAFEALNRCAIKSIDPVAVLN